jgi:hypothetical protein
MISLSIINYFDNLKKILLNQKKIIMNNHLYVILTFDSTEFFLDCQNNCYTKRNHYLQ